MNLIRAIESGGFFRRRTGPFLFALVFVWLSAALAFAQAPAQPEPGSPRARLESARNVVSSVDAALRGREPNDAELQRLRQGLDPARDELRSLVAETAPGLDQAKSQLEQLGPKPEKGPAETAELANERGQRERAVAELDEQLKLGKTLLVQAEQLINEIADRRRSLFARELFSRGQSLISFDLWRSAAHNAPEDVAVIQLMARDWQAVIWRGLSGQAAFVLFAGIAAAIALFFVRAWILPRLQQRLRGGSPNRLKLVAGAILQLLAGTLPALLGCWLILQAARAGGFAPDRFEPVLSAFLNGIVFLVFVEAMSRALLSPDAPEQRFFGVADRNARILAGMMRNAAVVVVASKFVEALLQATAAALSTSIVVRGVFAIAFAVAVARGLHRLRDTTAPDDDPLALHVPIDGTKVAPFRLFGWIVVVAITLTALAGYISFAAFLTDQAVWIFIIAVLATVLLFLIDDAANELFEQGGPVARVLQASVGLRMRSIEQLGVLGAGVLKLFVGFVTIMLILAPWGVESADLLSSLKAAFFGFKVGDVTLSLSSLIIAGAILAAGLAATRSLTRWLEGRFLPATDLDPGLRNSIKTGVGYVGVLAAIALSVSTLGLSLERLTIVAGALSVGIGFGLQSIVNNFVSGLILLWERSIKVGDWVVVGDEQGTVRRINVRATEIETFDKATVVVPNSNLISGVVKNRVHYDRVGRIILPVGVSYSADPEAVARLLVDCAMAHPEVMSEPPPRAMFKAFGESALNFELVCFVEDVGLSGTVISDLHFALFKAFKAAGVEIPFPQRDVNLREAPPAARVRKARPPQGQDEAP